MKVLAPNQSFFDIAWVGIRMLPYSLPRVRSLGLPPGLCCHGWACDHRGFFKIFFSCGKVRAIIKSFIFLGCPFYSPFLKENRLCWSIILFYTPNRLATSSNLNLESLVLGELHGIHHYFVSCILKVPGPSASFTPIFRVFLFLFYIQCPKFLIILSNSNKVKYVSSIFLERIIPDFFLLCREIAISHQELLFVVLQLETLYPLQIGNVVTFWQLTCEYEYT